VVIRSFLTALGFKADNKAALNYEQILNKIFNISKKLVNMTIKFGNEILNTAGEMEQWEIAFETMLRSTEKAEKLMKEVIEFAATTPFELPQVVEGSKRLLAFGISAESIIPTMTQLGNMAAGVGREKLPIMIRALGKVKLQNKLTGREIKSFVAAGVPLLSELAKMYGMTTAEVIKLSSAGKIGFDDVSKAIENMSTGTGQFANLMEKQSKSYLGILTNIKDQFTRIANEAGKEVLPIAKELANEVLKFLQVNRKFIALKIADFLKGVVKILAFLFFFIKRIFEIMKQKGTLDFFGKAFKEIADIFSFFISIIINVIGFLSKFDGIISIIVFALAAWTVAQWAINAALAANPISLIIIAIIALIAFIWLIVANWDKIAAFLKEIWDNIAKWFSDMWEGIKDTALHIWEGIVNGLKSLWEGFKNFVIEIWDNLLKVIEGTWNTIKGFIDEITGFFKGVGKGVTSKTAIEGWENILGKKTVEDLGTLFTGLFKSIGIKPQTQTINNDTIRNINPANNTNNTVTLKTDININIPPGTSEEQAKTIGSETRKVVKEELDKAMTDVMINTPYSTRGLY